MDQHLDGWALKRHALNDNPDFYFPVYPNRETAHQWARNVRREPGFEYSVVRVRRVRHPDGRETIIEGPDDWSGLDD